MSRVQFNPSTLKVSYDSATNKVQTVSFCGWPNEITATFSGVRKCSDNELWVGLNTSHILSMREDISPYGSLWDVIKTIDGIEVRIYYNADIGGGWDDLRCQKTAEPYYQNYFGGGFEGHCSLDVRSNIYVIGSCPNWYVVGYDGTGVITI